MSPTEINSPLGNKKKHKRLPLSTAASKTTSYVMVNTFFETVSARNSFSSPNVQSLEERGEKRGGGGGSIKGKGRGANHSAP